MGLARWRLAIGRQASSSSTARAGIEQRHCNVALLYEIDDSPKKKMHPKKRKQEKRKKVEENRQNI